MPDTFEIPDDVRRRWIEAEDEFFAGLPTQQPELYKQGIQTVRSLADALEDCFSPRELFDAYQERDEDWARKLTEVVLDGVPRGLSLPRARDAAFQLRHNELRPMYLQALQALADREANTEDWLKLYEEDGDYTGRLYRRRFDLSPSRTECLYLHPFMTSDGKYVHTYERTQFDPETGERLSDVIVKNTVYGSPDEALEAYTSEIKQH